MKITKVKYDLIIIGAGVAGLAHTVTAIEKGLSVLLLEKNNKVYGASVQNFGVIWPIGQPQGPRFERAMRTREKWIDMSEKAGFWVKKNGSLFLAYHHSEMELLSEYHKKFGFKTKLLSPNQITSTYNHVNDDGLEGGLYSETEITIDPGKAIYALVNWLKTRSLCDVHFNEQVTHVETGMVHTTKSVYEADQVLICSGADYHHLFPKLMEQTDLIRCKLQMMRTYPLPKDQHIGPTLCIGLTLNHYDSFRNCNSFQSLSHHISTTFPEYDKYGIHVMIAQNREGELIVGDSHEYGHSFDSINRHEINQLIINYCKRFMKHPLPAIKQHWNGIYTKADGRTEVMFSPEKDVTIINGLGGSGMTLSFGLAQEFLECLLVDSN